MKIIKWTVNSSQDIFGTLNSPKATNIILIAHNQNATEFIGICETVPEFTSELSYLEPDFYYFTYSPSNGYWLTWDLIDFVLKDIRNKELSTLQISYNGNTYDADEISQNRISSRIQIIGDNDIEWKTSDNVFVSLNKNDLINILTIAAMEQTSLWLKYVR